MVTRIIDWIFKNLPGDESDIQAWNSAGEMFCLAVVGAIDAYWLPNLMARADLSVLDRFVDSAGLPLVVRNAFLLGVLICLLRATLNAARGRLPFDRSLSVQMWEVVIGDLAERSLSMVETKGSLRARLWFWSQLLRSIPPVAWAHLKEIALGPFRRVG